MLESVEAFCEAISRYLYGCNILKSEVASGNTVDNLLIFNIDIVSLSRVILGEGIYISILAINE